MHNFSRNESRMSAARSRVDESVQGLHGTAVLTVVLVHVHFISAKGSLTELSDHPPWIEQMGP